MVLFTLFWLVKGEATSVNKFIYDYQTLITGIAAVYAAGYTVRQMIKSDEKQDKRHVEGMAFAMRGEIRRMDRGLHPQLEDIESVALRLNSLNFDPETYLDRLDPYYTWFNDIALPLQPIVTDVLEILQRQAIRDAAEFFDGDLLIAFEQAHENAEKVHKFIALHLDAHDVRDNDDVNDLQRYEQATWPEVGEYRVEQTQMFRGRVWALIRKLRRSAEQLNNLQARFELD
ncbi:hypothetical protein D3C80_1204300 [compost metagenome]